MRTPPHFAAGGGKRHLEATWLLPRSVLRRSGSRVDPRTRLSAGTLPELLGPNPIRRHPTSGKAVRDIGHESVWTTHVVSVIASVDQRLQQRHVDPARMIEIDASSASRCWIGVECDDSQVRKHPPQLDDLVAKGMLQAVPDPVDEPDFGVAPHRGQPIQHAHQRCDADAACNEYDRWARPRVQDETACRLRYFDEVTDLHTVDNATGHAPVGATRLRSAGRSEALDRYAVERLRCRRCLRQRIATLDLIDITVRQRDGYELARPKRRKGLATGIRQIERAHRPISRFERAMDDPHRSAK